MVTVFFTTETGNNAAQVTLEILNSIGVCIKKLEKENVVHSNNEIKIETNSFQPGIYYCRLKAGDTSIVRKIVILH